MPSPGVDPPQVPFNRNGSLKIVPKNEHDSILQFVNYGISVESRLLAWAGERYLFVVFGAAVIGGEVFFTNANGLGGYFNQLIIGNVLARATRVQDRLHRVGPVSRIADGQRLGDGPRLLRLNLARALFRRSRDRRAAGGLRTKETRGMRFHPAELRQLAE